MCVEEKKYFVLGLLEQPRQDKNILFRFNEINERTKEGPLSYVPLESPFAPLVSLVFLVTSMEQTSKLFSYNAGKGFTLYDQLNGLNLQVYEEIVLKFPFAIAMKYIWNRNVKPGGCKTSS